MALTYVPNSGQNLPQTRDSIRINFENIDSGFNANHVPLNTGANSGKHNGVTFPQLAGNPPQGDLLATLASEVMLFAKADANTAGGTGIYFMGPSAAAPYSITAAQLPSPLTNIGNGWTALPSGLLLQWGTMPASNSFQPFPFPNLFQSYCFFAIPVALSPGGRTNILQILAGQTLKNGTWITSNATGGAGESSTALILAIGM